MEEKKESIGLPVPSFSGIAAFPSQSISEVFPKEAEERSVKIRPGEMKKLRKLLQDEKVAAEAAKMASRKRDLFCIDLEKDYGLNGMMWTIDIDNGTIQVTGKRLSPEK